MYYLFYVIDMYVININLLQIIDHVCFAGHPDLLSYISIAENETKARVRFNLLERMFQPCGPPPDRPNLD